MGRGPGSLSGRARWLHRASAGSTRVSLAQSPALFGLLPLSQKARAPYGPLAGDDGMVARLCRARLSQPHGLAGAGSDLPSSTRATHADPHYTVGVSLLCWDSCALYPRTRAHDPPSDRRAPAPPRTPRQTLCMVVSIKMHPNQTLYAESRVDSYRPVY